MSDNLYVTGLLIVGAVLVTGVYWIILRASEKKVEEKKVEEGKKEDAKKEA